jgi:hypothetical protein
LALVVLGEPIKILLAALAVILYSEQLLHLVGAAAAATILQTALLVVLVAVAHLQVYLVAGALALLVRETTAAQTTLLTQHTLLVAVVAQVLLVHLQQPLLLVMVGLGFAQPLLGKGFSMLVAVAAALEQLILLELEQQEGPTEPILQWFRPPQQLTQVAVAAEAGIRVHLFSAVQAARASSSSVTRRQHLPLWQPQEAHKSATLLGTKFTFLRPLGASHFEQQRNYPSAAQRQV